MNIPKAELSHGMPSGTGGKCYPRLWNGTLRKVKKRGDLSLLGAILMALSFLRRCFHKTRSPVFGASVLVEFPLCS